MKKKIIGLALAVSMLGGFAVVPEAAEVKTPQYQETARNMEQLNRGLIATYRPQDGRSVMSNEAGVYLSWRLLGTESLTSQAFDIYRADSENGTYKKIASTSEHGATNYIDTAGTVSKWYKVVKAGAISLDVKNETPVKPGVNYTAKGSEVGNGNSEKNSYTYIDIPIVRPDPVKRGDGNTSYYYNVLNSDGSVKSQAGANDASVGDLDGDGDYEIVLKWDPNDSKDSAGSDWTGRTYLDGYKIDPNNTGYMWRIDLGPNITSGQHFSPFMVFDFDGDGKSEIAVQTAPGSIDGAGKYVTEAGDTEEIRKADNSILWAGKGGANPALKGKNTNGPEYLTIFDGETGEALCTTDFIPRGKTSDWGDSKANRSERYLGGVAYLDGVHPSLIMCRGYYKKAVIRAYTWDGETLSMTWECVGTSKSADSIYGQGNHNLSIADIDNDGKDEIVWGSVSIDDNGKAVGNTLLGHGDAMHVNDFNNDGVQEVFSVKEDKEGFTNNAANFRIASSGKILWGKGAGGDTGKGVMANIDDEYAKTHPDALALAWSSSHDNLFDLKGNEVAAKPTAGSRPMTNFLVYWDGDLSREILDDTIIGKYSVANKGMKRFYSGSGYSLEGSSSNNYTKNNPSLVADIWGDWREEIIMPYGKGQNDAPKLRIYTSTIPTEYRLTTLMHDSQYRCAIAWQNTAYNQPPHQSYYIGSAALAKNESGNPLNYLAPASPYTNVTYPSLNSIPVTGITLSKSSVEVERTKTVSVNASVLPDNASRKGIYWTSSDPSVATASNGIITGVSDGTAIITATTKDGGFSASCSVTVFSTPVVGMSLPVKNAELGVDCSIVLNAKVRPSDATNPAIIWTSSAPSVASVSQDGVVTGLSTGSATITAKTAEGGFSASCVINVKPTQTSNANNEDMFITTNTDSETVLSNVSASGATLSQTNAAVGAEFYKDFEAYSDNKATISFHLHTGGISNIINESSGWNWAGHEYTFGVQLLDKSGNNILTLSQAYDKPEGEAVKGGTLMSRIGNGDAATMAGDWNIVKDNIGQVQGSSKRWAVTVELDYGTRTAKASLSGCDGDWNELARYTKTFALEDGASFSRLRYYTTKDGAGGIYVSPTMSDVAYTRTTPIAGSTKLIYERGTDEIAWSNADVSDWKHTGDLKLDSENGRILYDPEKPSVEYSASKNFNLSNDAIITYDVDWYFRNAINREGNYSYIRFGSNFLLKWSLYNVNVSTDGGTTWSESLFKGANEVDYTKNIKLVIDAATKTIKSFSFDGSEISSYTNYTLPQDADIKSVTFGFNRIGGTDPWKYFNGIQKIRVSQFSEGEEPVAYPFIQITEASGKSVGFSFNRAEYNGGALIVGALYDGDKLVEVKTKDISALAEHNGNVIDSLQFNNDVDAYSIKLFVWKSLDDIVPVCTGDSY